MITFDIELRGDGESSPTIGIKGDKSPALVNITFARKLTTPELERFYIILGDLIKVVKDFETAVRETSQ